MCLERKKVIRALRSAKRFAQRVDHAPDRRPTINGRVGLDGCMAHLCLDHLQRHLPGYSPDTNGIAQPVRRRPGQALLLVGRQAGGPHRLASQSLTCS